MKITKKRLKEIILEEIHNFFNEKAVACPEPTQDLELNTKNRDAAIKAEHIQYGPLNLEDQDYYKRAAEHWNTDPEVAKKSNCGNCIAFDISPRMLDCLPGPVSEPIEDEEGKLGYCWMHHFKCHSARTCFTWAAGGPISEDKISEEWQEKNKGSLEEEVEQYQASDREDIEEEKQPGLWANIHAKRKRGEPPASPGDENYPKTLDIDEEKMEAVLEDGTLVCPVCLFELLEAAKCNCPDLVPEAEYQGRKVTLNKPIRTSGESKKFKVYVKDPKTGNVRIVRFGDPNMKIKKSDPERRKSFRARHKCDQEKPETSAGYWSCKMWENVEEKKNLFKKAKIIPYNFDWDLMNE